MGTEISFKLRANKHYNTLFIVDEASMLADIDDLMRFVYSGKNCKLLLIGDTAQLPPVGTEVSPALSVSHLEYQYNKEVLSTTLTEVLRQKKQIGDFAQCSRLRKTLLRAS